MYKIRELLERQKRIKESRIKAKVTTEKFVKKARFMALVGAGISPVIAARKLGIEIEPGEKPVPRDTHKTLRDNKTQNRFFTHPLSPRWSVSFVGVAEVEEGFKPFEARVYGNWADPSHNNYLPKMAPCFGTYKAVFGVDENNSTEKELRFNFINAISLIEEPATVEEIIYNLVDSGIIQA